MKPRPIVAILVAPFLLAACAGGSGARVDPAAPTTATGGSVTSAVADPPSMPLADACREIDPKAPAPTDVEGVGRLVDATGALVAAVPVEARDDLTYLWLLRRYALDDARQRGLSFDQFGKVDTLTFAKRAEAEVAARYPGFTKPDLDLAAVEIERVCGVDANADGVVAAGKPTTPSGAVPLASAAAFSGGNTDADIAAAVARFTQAGLAATGANFTDTCSLIDTAALSTIVGTPVTVDAKPYPLGVSRGYPSCTLLAAGDPTVALAYVHLAPSIAATAVWHEIGTLDGATPIAGLGEAASWSDGRKGSNDTNKAMVQVFVRDRGAESLFQGQATEPSRRFVPQWTVPKILLALAQIVHDLAR